MPALEEVIFRGCIIQLGRRYVPLRVVGLQIANYRIAAWSLPLAVAVAALLSLAKFNCGELHGWGTLVATGFIAVLASMAGLAMAWRYCRELKPRSEELERICRELADVS